MSVLSRRTVLSLSGVGLVGSLAGCLTSSSSDVHFPDNHSMYAEATVYHGPACGCCDEYILWLEDHGVEVSAEVVDDVSGMKHEFDIPSDLRSCHTVDYGEYIVEGHMPLDALLEIGDVEPDVDGIGLPGMPAGTPGMGGVKTEEYTIYQFENGNYDEFIVM